MSEFAKADKHEKNIDMVKQTDEIWSLWLEFDNAIEHNHLRAARKIIHTISDKEGFPWMKYNAGTYIKQAKK